MNGQCRTVERITDVDEAEYKATYSSAMSNPMMKHQR